MDEDDITLSMRDLTILSALVAAKKHDRLPDEDFMKELYAGLSPTAVLIGRAILGENVESKSIRDFARHLEGSDVIFHSDSGV